MKSLQPNQILAFLAVGLITGLSAAQLASGFGYAFAQSPWTLIATLPMIGVAVLIASLPIARYRRQKARAEEGKRAPRPNPFYAFRVLIIARATALTGALFAGWYLGGLAWLFGFSVAPGALVASSIFGLAGAAVMLSLALVAEHNCKAPSDPGEGV